ncbi:PREDICTED: sorting nexin-30-like [Papilio xuthus]|uniref:Sorting nexin-30-like n=1 Tax=Papilio xuthus TaxID=66420 RepID=A0AAJ6Z2D2_PAPXU|nr:PREDICTED: sorting nexin-30-like [Papilio xuthus]
MASDSSSAVLDLNDGDITEDMEAPSVTDDAVDGAPLIMEHGYDIAVKVDAPMKQLSTLETFVTYRVRCVCARWPTPSFVRRRYNHFKLLHRRLCAGAPLLAPPALPPLHSARQQLDRYQPAFVHIRALALHAFLDRVAKHPILTHSEDFRLFVTTPDEEFDKVFKSENNALNLWGLSSALYGSGESKPAPNGARVQDPEFTAAADYLQSLEQKLTTLCSLTTKLYKGSVALSGELSGGNTDDLHNKLEQASEALRSELSDWIPKTRAEVKSLLLELADRQVNTHAQTLAGWQQALRLATGSDVSEIFKTVSKTAVQNLSSSKCRADTPTDKDFEDLDNYSVEVSSENSISEVVNDSVVGNVDVHLESSASVQVNSDEKTEEKVSDPLQDFSEVDLS